MLGRPVTFIHVPKCGGTSFAQALRLRYIFSQTSLDLTASRAIRTAMFAATDDERVAFEQEHQVRDVMLAAATLRGKRCICAHVRYNPHLHDVTGTERIYATVLREPVARFISNFLYSRRQHHSPDLHDSFDRFLESPRALRYGSIYSFFFGGRCDPDALRDPATVAAAVANLRRFDVVGDLAHPDAFRRRMQVALGVRLIRRATNVRPSRDKIVPDANQMAALQQICEPDIAIYNAMKQDAPIEDAEMTS